MHASDGPIDILQDFANIYAREEMLAFFDFAIDRSSGPAVTGLCRISRPKSAATGSHYLSLTFVVDAPDDEARQLAQAALDALEPEAVRQALPEIREVIAVPTINSSSESFIMQADLLMQMDPPRAFIAQQLVPLLGRLTGFKVTDFVWWKTPAPGASVAGAAPPTPVDAGDSLVARFSKYLRQQLGLS
jgi:hypothetical protein